MLLGNKKIFLDVAIPIISIIIGGLTSVYAYGKVAGIKNYIQDQHSLQINKLEFDVDLLKGKMLLAEEEFKKSIEDHRIIKEDLKELKGDIKHLLERK